ncbi:MAG: phosphoribosyltransferase family protein [Candidatus Falkowbacteria bacterium]
MSLKNFLLDCFFPKQCYGCGAPNIWLCKECFESLSDYQGEVPRALLNTKNLVIAGEYKDPLLNNLIKAFKFNFNQELSLPLFIFLKKALDKKILLNNLSGKNWQNILVVPIPLHKARKKWRGFNQSELLAQEISNYYGWPLSLALAKNKKSAIQADLKEEARPLNQTGVFSWHGFDLTGHDIILVDDIITSGATINEAAKVLKVAGAGQVVKLALAKG